MTQEQKAKAYDEALERAKEMIKAMTNIGGVAKVDDIQYLFPELKESEDEKIRLFICDLITRIFWGRDWDISKKDCLAYLKKQKEPRDYRKLYKGVSQSEWFKENYEGKSLGEEQKPAELTPLADLLSNYLKNDFEFFATKKWDEKKWNEVMNIQASELLRYAKKELEKEQKPAENGGKELLYVSNKSYNIGYRDGKREAESKQEWSKEDEKMSEGFMHKLEVCDLLTNKEITWAKHRLNSLHPQPKPEWSEEDEKIIESINMVFDMCAAKNIATEETTLYKLRAWLKSRRPQPIQVKESYKDGFQTARHVAASAFMEYCNKNRPNGKMCLSNGECEDIENAFSVGDWAKIERYIHKYHWKPSEEQMRALKEVAYNLIGTGTATDIYLVQLYEQLKAIKEGKK